MPPFGVLAQAVHFAAQAVMSGVQDVVIACGVENMTMVPIGSNVADAYKAGHGVPMAPEIMEKYGEKMKERDLKMFSQFEGSRRPPTIPQCACHRPARCLTAIDCTAAWLTPAPTGLRRRDPCGDVQFDPGGDG